MQYKLARNNSTLQSYNCPGPEIHISDLLTEEELVLIEQENIELLADIAELETRSYDETDFHHLKDNKFSFELSPGHSVPVENITSKQFIHMPSMVNLSIGAVKQLDNETSVLFENLNAIIENLTARITELENK